MILVDTCVLIDVSADDPEWHEWSVSHLAAWSVRGPLITNPVIWCTDFASLDGAMKALSSFGLQWAGFPHAALYLASQAHLRYRRQGGTRAMVLPDFLIGAHAAVNGWPLLTRERRRFDAYFNGLEIVSPA